MNAPQNKRMTEEERRRIYSVFLRLHSHKATPTQEPVAHLLFYDTDCLSPCARLVRFTREDVCEELDKESPLVRWLLKQMTEYDCYTQRIVGLVFDKDTVSSDVLRDA